MKIIPRARTTDPETSHAAAASVEETSTKNRQAVYEVLRAVGPCTDEWLVICYQRLAESCAIQSPSGIRTRRAELVKEGRVIYTGEKTKGKTGRMMRVWKAV